MPAVSAGLTANQRNKIRGYARSVLRALMSNAQHLLGYRWVNLKLYLVVRASAYDNLAFDHTHAAVSRVCSKFARRFSCQTSPPEPRIAGLASP